MITPTDLRRARKIKRAGFQNALTTVLEVRRTGIPLSYAMAFLEKESGKGYNEFGSDPVRNPVKGGTVTKARYLQYLGYRKQGLGMQGVGPMQLTWYGYQDEADKLGGCWRPKFNMRVGFGAFVVLLRQNNNDKYAAAKAYNGTGPAADAYAVDWVAKQTHWNKYLES